jgi:alpha-glucosidase
VRERWGSAGAWPCWHIANHDMPRPATRWGSQAVRAAAVLEMTLPGVAVIYQGDEIGMADGTVPPERRRDRMGRDGCRTPMRWTSAPNAGFCPDGVEPWLPVGHDPPGADVATQQGDPDSVLALYRRLLALRFESPALNVGDFDLVEAAAGYLVFDRRADGEHLRVIVNMADDLRSFDVPPGRLELATTRSHEGEQVDGRCAVGGNEAVVLRLD